MALSTLSSCIVLKSRKNSGYRPLDIILQLHNSRAWHTVLIKSYRCVRCVRFVGYVGYYGGFTFVHAIYVPAM